MKSTLLRASPVPLADPLAASLAELEAHHRLDPYADWSVRAARLDALSAMLLRHRDAFADAIDGDFGHRSRDETALLEVFPCVDGVRHALREGRGWMRERRVPVSRWFRPASAWVLPQPLGTIGIMVPWNYPLFLSIAPLTGALAAGNRAMIKVSERTPRFGALLADLLPQAVGDDVVRVVNGDVDTAVAFSGLPFRHLLFTGSTGTGRSVMSAAARNLVPVTLELGGKCPAIVTAATFADRSRFAHAVRRIVLGKALNAGQTCIAPDHVLLPRAAIEPFIALATDTLRAMYPGGAASPDFTGIASDAQMDRLSRLLGDATRLGATAAPLMAGPTVAMRKMAVTALTGCPPDAQVRREEIFGPLLPLIACETLDDAIARVDDAPTPLALYLFDDSRDAQQRVLRDTLSGGVTLNDTLLHIAQVGLPFGGVGTSGHGHYRGRHGFDTLSKLKPVFRQSRFNGAALVAPPYRGRFRQIMKLMLR